MNTTEKNIDLSGVSVTALREALAEKEREEKALKQSQRQQYQDEKEAFIRALAEAFSKQSEQLKQLKEKVILGSRQLYEKMYEINDKKPKDGQRSFSIKSADNRFKVVVENQERFEFSEEAQVHITAIKDIFKAKFEMRNKGFYALLDSILMRNAKGDYDAKLLAKARVQVKKLEDETLIAEFDKLQDCMRVVGTSTYARVYEKNSQDKWCEISLNFSSL